MWSVKCMLYINQLQNETVIKSFQNCSALHVVKQYFNKKIHCGKLHWIYIGCIIMFQILKSSISWWCPCQWGTSVFSIFLLCWSHYFHIKYIIKPHHTSIDVVEQFWSYIQLVTLNPCRKLFQWDLSMIFISSSEQSVYIPIHDDFSFI